MKYAIYYGKEKPMVAIGKNQCNLLMFAEKYKGLHYYKPKCRATRLAIKRLSDKGYLQVDFVNNSFKFKYPE